MITRTEMIFRLGYALNGLERLMGYFTEEGSHRKVLVGLAMDLAPMAANAPLGIQINHIFVHSSTLLLGFLGLRRTVTNFSHKQRPPPTGSIDSRSPS